MAFPFFPESHPTMSVENYAYMRQLWQHRKAAHEDWHETAEHTEQSSLSREDRQSFQRQKECDTGSQGDGHPSRPARTFIPAGRQRAKSVGNRRRSNDARDGGDVGSMAPTPPTLSSTQPSTSPTIATSSTTTPITDPARYIFQLYSTRLTNPFSPQFELNPLLLNITQPLLSEQHPRQCNLKVLDLGGIEGSKLTLRSFVVTSPAHLQNTKNLGVYTQTIATLPHVAVCQLTQPQLSTSHSPCLPFRSKSFNVVTTRTLYKVLSNAHQPMSTSQSWAREIHRVLVRGGSFEFLFFDCHLSHAGPLTKELELYLYGGNGLCICSQFYEECTCSSGTATSEGMTGAQFLELLAREGFVTEKSTTLMFPFSLLSSVFSHDGQLLRVNQEDSQRDQANVTPLLASLMKAVDDECSVYKTAWRCIIGAAQKR